MFIAIDSSGQQFSALELETEEAYLRSSLNQLYCPECHSLIRYRSGTYRRPHFFHYHSQCTYQYAEPESEEHINGKLALYNRLSELYPNAQVELEFKIEETNQRSDVMVIHPDGQKWAFEYQCYKISDEVWAERHGLYKSAGVVDFWVLGESVHRYGITDGKADTWKHRLVALARAIYQIDRYVVFLNSETLEMRVLDGGFLSGTILEATESITCLSEAFIKDGRWYWPELVQRIEQQRQADLQAAYEQEAMRLLRSREELLHDSPPTIATNPELILAYESLIRNRESFTDEMTNNQRAMFTRLCKKHNFTRGSFPGLLNLQLEHAELIRCPTQLWQLWVYDRFIFKREKVWVPKVKDNMYEQRHIFRPNLNRENTAHFSFAIYRFFTALEDLGLVESMGHRRQYYRVLVPVLPGLKTRVENIHVKMITEQPFQVYPQEFYETYWSFMDSIEKSMVHDIQNTAKPMHSGISKGSNRVSDELLYWSCPVCNKLSWTTASEHATGTDKICDGCGHYMQAIT